MSQQQGNIYVEGGDSRRANVLGKEGLGEVIIVEAYVLDTRMMRKVKMRSSIPETTQLASAQQMSRSRGH